MATSETTRYVAQPIAPVGALRPGHGRRWYGRFLRNRLSAVGAAIVILFLAIAIFGPYLLPYDADKISYDILVGPSLAHPLGTDDVGRDLLSRLIAASRISLTVGLVVATMSSAIGTAIGALAGYFGGWIDSVLSGLINVMLSIPLLPLVMVLGAFVSTDLTFIILILGLTTWNGTARIIRAECLNLREREYVSSARVIGATNGRIILRHILPNVLALVIVATTLQVAGAILAESALSYLGFGIQPPQASWGNMLQNAQRYFRTNPAIAIYPGVLISLTVISVNFIGDGLRDALDPRLRR